MMPGKRADATARLAGCAIIDGELTLRDAPEILTRKEVCYYFDCERTTVWRWEKEGAPFIGGRVRLTELVWWMEQREAAKRLGIPVLVFLEKPRQVREKLIQVALLDATLCNIPAVDGNPRKGQKS